MDINQVSDNPALLKLMLEDSAAAPHLYQATHFWNVYEKLFLPELHRLGLHDFRRRKNSVLSSFGATDMCEPTTIDLSKSKIFNNRILRNIKKYRPLLSRFNTSLNKIMPVTNLCDIRLKDFQYLCYEFARLRGKAVGAKSLDQLEPSLVGNPMGVIDINKKKYTISILNYYLRYAYCCQYIDFDAVHVIVELGSGAGKEAEVLKKLHPKLCILLFDIPPQLYVCEQYLKAVFPDSVVSYQETRNLDELPKERAGKIFIFGAHKFPILKTENIDLFWNSASLQEMEPDVVKNYLSYVNEHSRAVYLHQWMSGIKVAKKKGHPGVLKQTQFKDYKAGLPNFELVDLSPALIVPKMSRSLNYRDSFWKCISR